MTINKAYCGRRNGKGLRNEILREEIDGFGSVFITLKQGKTFKSVQKRGKVRVFLVISGKGKVTEKNMRFTVDGVSLFVPAPGETCTFSAIVEDFIILEISIALTAGEMRTTEKGSAPFPYFIAYADAPKYRESIKSPKTISRMILPEDIVPRFCVGSVETTGPDEVGTHSHPMLEQMFFGLPGNKCVVTADDEETVFDEHVLLHIPLGSEHGVKAGEDQYIHYIWMDLFRSADDMGYIGANHILVDP